MADGVAARPRPEMPHNPQIVTTQTGYRVLVLAEDFPWAAFPSRAEYFLKNLGATIGLRHSDAVDHTWQFEWEETSFALQYFDYPNEIHISPENSADASVLERLCERIVQLGISIQDVPST